jgi:hypothetical protein
MIFVRFSCYFDVCLGIIYVKNVFYKIWLNLSFVCGIIFRVLDFLNNFRCTKRNRRLPICLNLERFLLWS